jgi:hypothetical protein
MAETWFCIGPHGHGFKDGQQIRRGGNQASVGFCPSLNIGPGKSLACDGYDIANGDAAAAWKYGNRIAVAVGVWSHEIFVCVPRAGCV